VIGLRGAGGEQAGTEQQRSHAETTVHARTMTVPDGERNGSRPVETCQ
jgi:hypothetical protein